MHFYRIKGLFVFNKEPSFTKERYLTLRPNVQNAIHRRKPSNWLQHLIIT